MADRILMPFRPKLSTRAQEQLAELHVDVRTGVRVTRIDENRVSLADQTIPSATVLWGAGVTPSPLARSIVASHDQAGRVIVEQDCSVPGHPEAFVIGDMARFVPPGWDKPLPCISPVAIQEGRAVAGNIMRSIRGRGRRPFVYWDKGFIA